LTTRDKWNANGYALTGEMLQSLASNGENIVYTDSAWWHANKQLPDADQADETLQSIRASLNHLVMPPGKIGKTL